MQRNEQEDTSNFWVVGVNYRKTEASIRGQYAINNAQYHDILTRAKAYSINRLFVLSTCNRTEIYGFAETPVQLMELLCSETKGDINQLKKVAYVKSDREAIKHVFQVSAGLDSQILGDYEIMSQLKQAFKISKAEGFTNTFLERLISSALQASKAVKSQTFLSDGTVSVSFAAIQYIREKVADIHDKKILLIGTGKIGRNTCKNIITYLQTKQVTVINRTAEKAKELATELGIRYSPASEMIEQLKAADIVLVASNSSAPIVHKSDIENCGSKLIIDLSIPYNVSPAVQALPDVTLLNVDKLSAIKDITLDRRKAEVPKAMEILAFHINEFLQWYKMRQHIPMLMEVKKILSDIHTSRTDENTFCPIESTQKIQKAITGLAVKMKKQQPHGCDCIEIIHQFVA